MAFVGVAEPAMTELQHADELLQICSSIGLPHAPSPDSELVYTKGAECRGSWNALRWGWLAFYNTWPTEVLNDLLRGIRRDGRHSTQSFIRQLGVFGILEKVRARWR